MKASHSKVIINMHNLASVWDKDVSYTNAYLCRPSPSSCGIIVCRGSYLCGANLHLKVTEKKFNSL